MIDQAQFFVGWGTSSRTQRRQERKGKNRLLGSCISGPSASISGPGCCPGILESQVVDRSCHGRSVDRRESRNFFRTKIGTKDPILVNLDFTTP